MARSPARELAHAGRRRSAALGGAVDGRGAWPDSGFRGKQIASSRSLACSDRRCCLSTRGLSRQRGGPAWFAPHLPWKADLHLHSRYSDRAPEWLFRRAGLPDSYSEPADLYDELRARDEFVTITDHNHRRLPENCRPAGRHSQRAGHRAFPGGSLRGHLLVWGPRRSAAPGDCRRRAKTSIDLQKYLAAAKARARSGASALPGRRSARRSAFRKAASCSSATSRD